MKISAWDKSAGVHGAHMILQENQCIWGMAPNPLETRGALSMLGSPCMLPPRDPFLMSPKTLRPPSQVVQCRAVGMVKGDYNYDSSITNMLVELGWMDLAGRRRDLWLLLFYKAVHGHIAIPLSDILTPADTRTQSSHSKKFKHISTNTKEYRNSFIPNTIKDWNLLDITIADAKTPVSSKEQLSRQWTQCL